MARIAIVGGGISGLALAHRLEQRQPTAEVLVLEQSSRVGGKIQTLQRDGFRIETGPNGFLDSKPAALDLSREIGLGDRLTPASEASGRNRFLCLGGRLQRLPSSFLAFLTSRVVSWRAKCRILTERWRRPGPLEGDESIESFVTRRVGAEVANSLADAFVTGIYAGDPALLSAPACFPRLVDWERQYGSILRGMAQARRQRRAEASARGEKAPARQQLWSFREGLGLLIDTLRQRLRRPPLVGVSVRRLLRSSDQRNWQIEAEGKDSWRADAVVLACPADQQAAILTALDLELASKVAEIPYNSIAVVALGYRAGDVPGTLDGFGYLAPRREGLDVLGVQWCSSIYPGRAPEGMVLLRALCGGWNRPEIVSWDDERLLQAVRANLGRTMGIKASPAFHAIVRWDRAIPQYHLGHLERVAWIGQRCRQYPGLYLAGNAYHGVALNDCIEQGDRLADQVLGELALK